MANMSFQHGANVDSYDNLSFQEGVYSRTAGGASASVSTSVAAQAANLVHQTYEKVRREHEEAHARARWEEVLLQKNHISKMNSSGSSANRPSKRRKGASVNIASYFRGKETEGPGYNAPAEQHVNYNMGYGMPVAWYGKPGASRLLRYICNK